MRAWLGATLVAAAAVGGGWLYVLNPDPVTLQLAPSLQRTWPLGGLVAGAFTTGIVLAAVLGGLGALARRWRAWRAQRAAQKAAAVAARTEKARELVWSGSPTLARRELARAGEPTADPQRALLLAEAQLAEGTPADARRTLEAALGVTPPTPELLDLLATAAEATDDHGAAVAALERARTLRPGSPRLLARLRDAYAAGGRIDDALTLQAELLLGARSPARLAEEEQRLRQLRVAQALAEPDHRRAARLLDVLVAENPGDVDTVLAAGARWTDAGDGRRARRAWIRGLAARADARLLDALTAHDAASGRADRTRRTLRRLRRRRPDDVVLALGEVRALLAVDALDDAAAALDALTPATAATPAAQALRGTLCRRRGDVTGAADAFAAALDDARRAPSSPHQGT